MSSLPKCFECKARLFGPPQQFECDLLEYQSDSAILLYVVRKQAAIGRVTLPPGSLSYGLFAVGDPFVAYCWHGPDGLEIAWYVNVADSVEISPPEVRWRDLVLDVLIYPDYTYDLLDQDEIPPQTDVALLQRIRSTADTIVENRQTIVDRCRERTRRYVLALQTGTSAESAGRQ